MGDGIAKTRCSPYASFKNNQKVDIYRTNPFPNLHVGIVGKIYNCADVLIYTLVDEEKL